MMIATWMIKQVRCTLEYKPSDTKSDHKKIDRIKISIILGELWSCEPRNYQKFPWKSTFFNFSGPHKKPAVYKFQEIYDLLGSAFYRYTYWCNQSNIQSACRTVWCWSKCWKWGSGGNQTERYITWLNALIHCCTWALRIRTHFLKL